MKISNLLLTLIMALFSITSNSAKLSPCDTEECQQYFKKYKNFARIGYADAMSALGEFYYHGYGTEKNLDKALKQFRRATKYGAYAAPVKVALLRLTEPSLRDTEEAIKYLKKAARNNNPDANFLLGMIYYSHNFGEYDIKLSDKHLTKAYDLGHYLILEFISYMQSKNTLTPENFPELTAQLGNSIKRGETKKITDIKNFYSNSFVQNTSLIDDIEVIEVQEPALSEIFDEQFEIFKHSMPNNSTATGTLIKGRTCDKMVNCKTVSKDDFKRIIDYMN